MARTKITRTVTCDHPFHAHKSLEAARACVEVQVFGPVSAIKVFGVRPTIAAIREAR